MTVKILSRIARGHLGGILGFVFLGLLGQFCIAYSARLLQLLLDAMVAGTASVSGILFYAGILGIQLIAFYLQNMPDARLESQFLLELKTEALRKMRTIDYLSYLRLGTGTLVERCTTGAQAGAEILKFGLDLVGELLPTAVFSLFFVAQIDRTVFWLLAGGYGLVFVLTRLLLRSLYRAKEQVLTGQERLTGTLVRGFMELVVFRIHRRYAREIRRAQEEARRVTGGQVRLRMIHEAFFTLFALLILGVKVGILLYALQAGTTVGSVAALLALVDNAYTPVAICNVRYITYKLNRAAFVRLEEIYDAPDAPRQLEGASPAEGPMEVCVDQVTAGYGDRTVLREVSFCLKPGQVTGLVGESGAGKSTLLHLLTGLTRPQQGVIWVRGQDLSTLCLEEYMAGLAYIPQEAPVFDGTLRENLEAAGIQEDARLQAALAWALLPASRFPQGLDTPVGERGVILSGGERQRLALARLYLSPAPLVILDEALSALDRENARILLDRMLGTLQGRTVLMITHREEELARCHRVLRLEHGKIIEEARPPVSLKNQ